MFMRGIIKSSNQDFIEIDLIVYDGARGSQPSKLLKFLREEFQNISIKEFKASLSLYNNNCHFNYWLETNFSGVINSRIIELIPSLLNDLPRNDRLEVLFNQQTARNQWQKWDFCRDIWIAENLLSEKTSNWRVEEFNPCIYYTDPVDGSLITVFRANYKILFNRHQSDQFFLKEVFRSPLSEGWLKSALTNKEHLRINEDVVDLMKPFIEELNAKDKLMFLSVISDRDIYSMASQIDSINFLIDEHISWCKRIVHQTNSIEELNLAIEFTDNTTLWKGGHEEVAEILFQRLVSFDFSNEINDGVVSFLISFACNNFPSEFSLRISNLLMRHLLVSEFDCIPSQENQIRLFNLCSAFLCDKFVSDSKNSGILAYSNIRVTEIFQSVRWSADRVIKKFPSLLAKGEYRVGAAVLNKIVLDLKGFFVKTELSNFYIDVILATQPDEDWLSLCENMPVLRVNPSVHTALAKFYIDKNLEKSKCHVDALIDFEPESIVALKLKREIEKICLMNELAQKGISIDALDKMSGVDFEMLIISKLRLFGFKVSETPKSGDYGADIIIDDDEGTRFIIQCKRFGSKVNLKAVQEVVGASRHYGADYAIVATNNLFLKSAIELAQSNSVELWSGDEILRLLNGDIGFSVLKSAKTPSLNSELSN